MIVEIRAREICPDCKGTGRVKSGEHIAHFERFLSCMKCLGHQYIEMWVPLDDLQLSHELTIAIREKFAHLSKP